MNNEREQYIEGTRKEFTEYLGDRTFTPDTLKDFCINQKYFTQETNLEAQKNNKAFLETYAPQIEECYNGNKSKARSFLQKIYKGFHNEHIKSWDTYLDSVVNFDDSKDYHSKIFERRFPIGTISYIGARPGRGKTTMLVNIALDAINQGKPVVFVTAEETTKQIITRFILALAYSKHKDDERTVAENFQSRKSLFGFLKGFIASLQGTRVLNDDLYQEASEIVRDLIKHRQLEIFEAYGASWDDMKDYLSNQEAGTVVLIDYIQHLKCPEGLTSQTRQIQIQEASHQLADLSGVYEIITICGAQFKRPDAQSSKKEVDDYFDETSFREAGDIEQDGHILIGIGKNTRTGERFYSCMKDREASPDDGKCWKLEENLGFSYMWGAKDKNDVKIPYTRQGKTDKEEDTTPVRAKPKKLPRNPLFSED